MMKVLINIICVTIALSFINIEVQANPILKFSKLLKFSSNAAKLSGKTILKSIELTEKAVINCSQPWACPSSIHRLNQFIRENTINEFECQNHNKNINEKKYQDSLLEKLPKEDNSNNKSNENLFSYTIELKWENGKCLSKIAKKTFNLKNSRKKVRRIADSETDQ